MAGTAEVLNFWFGAPGSAGYGEKREIWFKKDADFDAEIRHRFLPLVETARRGELEHWLHSASTALALCIVLDQFPRNLFRGAAEAFASDALARDMAGRALERGFDGELPKVQRIFLYLPFEHSEDLSHQVRSLNLFSALVENDETGARTMKAARRHHEIIARFGRFPHRNAALGRPTTAAEAEFLKEPDSSF
ncbi:MAG TPA: DUF924 family protein [Alphaproteobacteria bacterium]|jgi:uncharacterized protein (DUF924 family)|nr:DUF924 family protein [Alphaproteobacteria bacterium]HJM48612.1 DUF924 family protein [Alphaproteobacteria bacterium]|tara:strand:- start:1391 stop:1969 length:579 start_codon:yes stop_codon:yes gene_type:complete